MPDHQPLSDLLREWRERRHMTQPELADAADVSVRMIQEVEAGNRHFGAATAPRIAEALRLNKAETARLNSFVRSTPALDLRHRHDDLAALVARLSASLEELQAQVVRMSATLDQVERWRRDQG